MVILHTSLNCCILIEQYFRIKKRPFFLLIMSFPAVPVAKRPRISITNAQKKALRAWYYTPSPKKTLADASAWWYAEHGYPLSSSTAHDILSAKNSHLDSDQVDLKAKNSRAAKWDTLEKALGDWATRFDQAHGTVSGDLLRLKATEFW